MNYSIRVGETVLHLFGRVQSAAVLRGSAYCSVSPPALVHLIKRAEGSVHFPVAPPPPVLHQSKGRQYSRGPRQPTPTHPWGGGGLPYTADVVWDHVAALVAVKSFGKFWEVLKRSEYPEFSRTVNIYFDGINRLLRSVRSTPNLCKV